MNESVASQIDIVVTVSEDRRGDLEQIALDLERRGVSIASTLHSLGMILGTASASALAQIRNADGIAAVEAAGSVQLPPPGSEVQ
jgi:hypothetical protein